MIFGGIQKVSTIDFPSVLSCVVFTRGCDLNCFYCHNRELIQNSDDSLSEEQVFDFLKKRKGLLDGVVVSGGEPTIQKDLVQFLEKVKSMGFKIKLDTNGQNPQKVKEILEKNLVDYVAVDIKATQDKYLPVCGKDAFKNVSETVKLLISKGVSFEVRTTLYPSMKLEELKKVLNSFEILPRWRLNFFKMPKTFRKQDENLLSQKCITEQDIKTDVQNLKKIQPNLIW